MLTCKESLLKTYYILITLISTLLFNGCGGTSDQTSTDNTSLSSNELGFYGLSAQFGSRLLLDRWEAAVTLNDTNTTLSGDYVFRNDGVFSTTIDAFTYGIYGVDAPGKHLHLKGYLSDGSSYTIRVNHERSDMCLETELLTTDKQVFAVAVMCPKNVDNTPLISGVNVGKSVNQSGYFGSNVLFGAHLIVGRWNAYGIDKNGSISALPYMNMQFLEDGSAITNTDSGVAEIGSYGVNEDATQLYPYSIIKSLNDSCYEVASAGQFPIALCKID